MSDRIRLYLIGGCDGFDALHGQLANHTEIELVGQSEHVGQATAILAGGHLDCVVYATREPAFWWSRSRRRGNDANTRSRPAAIALRSRRSV